MSAVESLQQTVAKSGAALVACAPDDRGRLEGVPLTELGVAGGDSVLGHPLAELRDAWGEL